MNATPAWALWPRHNADRKAGSEPEAFRFVDGGDLAQSLSVTKFTVRTRILRLRESFAAQFEAIEGYPPSAPILVQSQNKRKYRLDPEWDIACEPQDNDPNG